MTGLPRVCDNPRCAKPIPDGRRAHAKYCHDDCKREAHRIRTRTERPSRMANRFWAGYGRHVRARPEVRPA